MQCQRPRGAGSRCTGCCRLAHVQAPTSPGYSRSLSSCPLPAHSPAPDASVHACPSSFRGFPASPRVPSRHCSSAPSTPVPRQPPPPLEKNRAETSSSDSPLCQSSQPLPLGRRDPEKPSHPRAHPLLPRLSLGGEGPLTRMSTSLMQAADLRRLPHLPALPGASGGGEISPV